MDEGEGEGLDELLRRAAGGEAAALADLFDRHRGRLRQMVRLRLDRRLQGRVDPSDVLQEAFIDLAEKLPEYAQNPRLPWPREEFSLEAMGQPCITIRDGRTRPPSRTKRSALRKRAGSSVSTWPNTGCRTWRNICARLQG